MVDISRSTAGVVLPSEVSGTIWQGVQETSAVAALSNRINLPGAGATIETITGDPTPNWVAETAIKPLSRPTLGSKVMKGYTLAVVVPFSNQFRRDKGALFSALVDRLPGTLAAKIDSTVFGGTTPGTGFDVLTAAPTVALDGTGQAAYDALVDAEVAIAVAGGHLSGYALSAQGVGTLRKVKDANGLPLLGGLNGFDSLLGYPVKRTQVVYSNPTDPAKDTVGYAGDWSAALFGVVEDISVSISDQASVTDGGTVLNLWERNMFAVRVEMEVGFIARDVNLFRRLTGVATAP